MDVDELIEEIEEPIEIEVFTSEPPCEGCKELTKLSREIAKIFGEKVILIELPGEKGMEKWEEYELTCAPAVVIGEVVRIMGVCPSKETFITAIAESAGLA